MSIINFIKIGSATLGLAFFAISSGAQESPGVAVERWKLHLPYNQVTGIATDNTTFFVGTTGGFFTYNRDDGSLNAYSKVNGMSDVGLNCVAYDALSKTAVLGYSNSNIDLFKDGTFYNLPELKLSQASGDKTIYNVVTHEASAYMSTAVGLLIVNLNKKEIKETVTFFDSSLVAAVNAAVIDNDGYIYAATNAGLFKTQVSNANIVNYSSWIKISSQSFKTLAFSQNNTYASSADSLFVVTNNAINFLEVLPKPIIKLDQGTDGLWISTSKDDEGEVIKRMPDGTKATTFSAKNPTQVVELANSEIWYGDNSRYAFPDSYGFRKRSTTGSTLFIPNGPVTSFSFDVSAYDGSFWVAHGGYDESFNPTYSRANFSHFAKDGVWRNYPWVSSSPWVQDFIRIIHDPETNKVYASSFSGGLYIGETDGSFNMYSSNQYLSPKEDEQHLFMTSGLALDRKKNLWIGNNRGLPELTVRTASGEWYKMKTISDNGVHSILDIVVDDYDQKWFVAPNNGGVIVYNDNNTIENAADDTYRVLRVGAGAGNLPSAATTSIAKDKDGYIWIGTTNGIGIVKCPNDVIKMECEASMDVIQEDEFGGYLFEGQAITAIAVDGANRKWIGTSFGAWLVSENADETIYRFTENNSPLPSSSIQRINIDPITGDVYFSTAKGLACFRSTATEGSAQNEDPLFVYPNPVPSNFSGMIAVRGIAENSDVRFTDITGQLVYRTTALGGQAVWNGYDYAGRKAQSGVYLVFVVNRDGTEKAKGKFIIQR